MKNIMITAVTLFAFTASVGNAGEMSMDMGDAFAYSQSAQSQESGNIEKSTQNAPGSFEGINAAIWIGVIGLVLLCAVACGSDSQPVATTR